MKFEKFILLLQLLIELISRLLELFNILKDCS